MTPKMRPVRVNEGVGDEGPHIRAATRQRVAEHDRTVVAGGNERERQQKFDVLLLAEQKMRTTWMSTSTASTATTRVGC